MTINKNLSTVAFWGGVWGAVEATLGSLLHAVDFAMGWLVWYPIAFFFMNKVYRRTGKSESILLLAAIAATIKLVDLALPVRIDRVVNPAVSILLEGLVVFAVFRVLERPALRAKAGRFAAIWTSFAWRLFYAAYVLLLPSWMVAISPVRGLAPFARFLLLEGGANALLIVGVQEVHRAMLSTDGAEQRPSSQNARSSGLRGRIDRLPVPAMCLLAAAIVMQWVL